MSTLPDLFFGKEREVIQISGCRQKQTCF